MKKVSDEKAIKTIAKCHWNDTNAAGFAECK